MAAKLQVVQPTAFKVGFDVPSPGFRGKLKHPEVHRAIAELAAAPIGASFFAPSIKITAIQQAAWRFGGRGWVTIRKADDGYRVWKLCEPSLRAQA